MLAGRRLSRFKRVGWFSRQIRKIRLRRDDEALGAEATNALLPGKASKHQVTSNRTPNRHRWSGREYQGA